MADKKVVLVTGVADHWGAQVAKQLCLEPNLQVVGLDFEPAPFDIEGLDFISIGVEDPGFPKILTSKKVNVICHLKFTERVAEDKKSGESNLRGMERVLEASVEAGVEQIIVRSSTAVYGAHPDNAAFLTEEMPLRGSLNYGYTRDWLEIESLTAESDSVWLGIPITILRFANIVGPTAIAPLTLLLKQKTPSVLLGFDPVMQMIHEQDVLSAIVHSVIEGEAGIYNIAADGPMPLSRIMRLAHRLPIPVYHRFAYHSLSVMQKLRLPSLEKVPIEWDYLRYRWNADTRKMREVMKFEPAYTSEETLLEFAEP